MTPTPDKATLAYQMTCIIHDAVEQHGSVPHDIGNRVMGLVEGIYDKAAALDWLEAHAEIFVNGGDCLWSPGYFAIMLEKIEAAMHAEHNKETPDAK